MRNQRFNLMALHKNRAIAMQYIIAAGTQKNIFASEKITAEQLVKIGQGP